METEGWKTLLGDACTSPLPQTLIWAFQEIKQVFPRENISEETIMEMHIADAY
jgi:hypothetical protein